MDLLARSNQIGEQCAAHVDHRTEVRLPRHRTQDHVNGSMLPSVFVALAMQWQQQPRMPIPVVRAQP
jgi:hypothetical protein